MKRGIGNAGGIAVFFAVLAACGCGAQADGSRWVQKAAPSWSGLHTVEVKDPAEGETAFTIDAPSAWKYEGTILRPRGCHAPGTPADGLSYGIASPDGLTAVGQMPGVSWDWVSDGSTPSRCASVDVTTAAGFLLNIAAPNTHPNAKIIGIVPLPAQMQAGLAAQQQRLASGGGPVRQLIDTARVRVQYPIGGQMMEEQMGVVLTCLETHFPAYPMMHRAARTTRHCMTHGTYFQRAPLGQLDQLLSNSIKPPAVDHQWDAEISQQMRAQYQKYKAASDAQFAAIQQHFQQQTAAMLQRGAEQQAITRRGTDIAMANDRNTVAAMSRGSHMQVLDSLNHMTYVDSSTGRKYETSNEYTHNWISSDGTEAVVGDDSTFNPNGVIDPVRQSWTELVPAW